MSVIEAIRNTQDGISQTLWVKPDPTPHEPEMLLMGCVDARINVKDLGIPDGKALIYRSVGATVDGLDASGNAIDLSEAAAIDVALNRLTTIKDVVIMGHTNCAGMAACLECCGGHHHVPVFLGKFLEPFKAVAQTVLRAVTAEEDRPHAMEKAAIINSIKNLQSYPAVREAMARGVRIHGWLLNTDSKLIEELDIGTEKFKPMSKIVPPFARVNAPGNAASSSPAF